LKNITIPATCSSINNYAFRGCVNLESVTYLGLEPPSCAGYYAFYGAAVSDVCVPVDYNGTKLCNFNVYSDVAPEEWKNSSNSCYEAFICGHELLVRMKENASFWEGRLEGCYVHKCDNTSGIEMVYACSEKQTCLRDMCVDNKEIDGWIIHLDFDPLDPKYFNESAILSSLNNLTGISVNNMRLSVEMNVEGQIIRISIIVSTEDNADKIINVIKNLPKGDECNLGEICRLSKAKKVPKEEKTSGASRYDIPLLTLLISTIITFVSINIY